MKMTLIGRNILRGFKDVTSSKSRNNESKSLCWQWTCWWSKRAWSWPNQLTERRLNDQGRTWENGQRSRETEKRARAVNRDGNATWGRKQRKQGWSLDALTRPQWSI
jgi:hypothetical protein